MVEKRIYEFLRANVSDMHGCIVQINNKKSPMYTSYTRAHAYMCQEGAGIPPTGGIFYQLVPYSDVDVARVFYFDHLANFEEVK